MARRRLPSIRIGRITITPRLLAIGALALVALTVAGWLLKLLWFVIAGALVIVGGLMALAWLQS
jgi:hypothetical protein